MKISFVTVYRIRLGLLTGVVVASRAKARGVSEAGLMGGNFLAGEMRGSDVAQGLRQPGDG